MVATLIRDRDYAIVNATLVTLAPLATQMRPTARISDADLGIVADGAVVVAGGRIIYAGDRASSADARTQARRQARDAFPEIDAGGCVVMPGLVDAHTHAIFAGNRVADLEALAAGEKPRLGMRHTIDATRRCTLDDLITIGEHHLSMMAAHGTTTAEIKSGYALTAQGEAAILQAMRSLDQFEHLPHVVPTFCGAHALPPEFDDYDDFVKALCDEILPAVAPLRIAKFADAFCEKGYFSVAQSRAFLRACAKAGMGLRLHADELAKSGGTELAAELRCASADHLNFADEPGVAALAQSGAVAVLCPTTNAYLGLDRWAPARLLIDSGVPVAVATDFNPGTSPCWSLQMAAHLARRHLRLTVAETITAVTLNAAHSLGAAGHAGALLAGYPAALVALDLVDYREFGYFFGANLSKFVAIGVKGSSRLGIR